MLIRWSFFFSNLIFKLKKKDINRIDTEIRLLKDKQQQLANVLDDKQKNLQSLQQEDEEKTLAVDELVRKKQEVFLFSFCLSY